MKRKENIIFLLLGIVFLTLQSPKWLFPPAAWLAPFFLLMVSQNNSWWKGTLLILAAAFVSGIAAQYNVMPFPLPLLVIIVLTGSVLYILPYLMYKLLSGERKGYWRTLIFPASFLAVEYYHFHSSSGVWQSVSGTQYGFLPLIQSASVAGIWGVVFFIYWFASTAVYVVENRKENPGRAKKAGVIFLSVFAGVLLAGFFRMSCTLRNTETVKIAAVTVDNSVIYETIYRSVTGEDIHFSATVSPNAPVLAGVNRAMMAFLSDPDNPAYEPVKTGMVVIQNRAFEKSRRAAEEGSRIILWSEGLGLTMSEDKEALIKKGQQFAREHHVCLLLAYAAFYGGIPHPGDALYENRVVTIGPGGEILNVFDKNVPVPNVERSAPGDGTIPVIKTGYARISPSICYDADFPRLIAQTGRNGTEILLVPASDWIDISPYHSRITRFRAIENGVSVVKSVRNGLSVAYDPCGRILGESDFFDGSPETMVAEVPVTKVRTLYPVLGDFFAQIWILFLLSVVVLGITDYMKRRLRKKEKTETNII